jgi:hypothetical protein
MVVAAGPGPAYGNRDTAGYAGRDAVVSESFVDADGNGICDNYEVRVSLQDGTGTPGANFVDADGDGVCDNCLNDGTHPQDGTGLQMG